MLPPQRRDVARGLSGARLESPLGKLLFPSFFQTFASDSWRSDTDLRAAVIFMIADKIEGD
jgi:hypothetical protein